MSLIPSVSLRRKVAVPVKGARSETYAATFDGIAPAEHFVFLFSGAEPRQPPLVRVHSECASGDVFGSLRCDCRAQLEYGIQCIDREGGALVYLRQEGRGIGFSAKMDAYAMQDQGHDTFAANRLLGHEDDAREFRIAGYMLLALGMRQVRLLSNNPQKRVDLLAAGVDVVDMMATPAFETAENRAYLQAKRELKQHRFAPSNEGENG